MKNEEVLAELKKSEGIDTTAIDAWAAGVCDALRVVEEPVRGATLGAIRSYWCVMFLGPEMDRAVLERPNPLQIGELLRNAHRENPTHLKGFAQQAGQVHVRLLDLYYGEGMLARTCEELDLTPEELVKLVEDEVFKVMEQVFGKTNGTKRSKK